MSKKVYLAGAMTSVEDKGALWRNDLTQFFTIDLGWEVYSPLQTIGQETASAIGMFPKLAEATKIANGGELTIYKMLDFARLNASLQVRAKLTNIIVESDLDLIRKSNVLLVYFDKNALSSAGTLGEITFAKTEGLDVCLVLVHLEPKDVPDWVMGCTNIILPNIEEAKKFFLSIV